MVTFDKSGNPIMESQVRIPYESAVGPVWHRFFEAFKHEKILGTRCPECNRVLVPARAFCPRCFVDMSEWLEVSQEGVITAWAYTNYEFFGMPIPPPFINAMIRLDGTDCEFIHLIGGFDLSDIDKVRKKISMGMKVQAVWKKEKTGCIMDIEYFKPSQNR